MPVLETPERPGTPLAAARDVWGRAVAQLDAGTLSRRDYENARQKLRAVRALVTMPERSRVDVYLELLAEAWDDRSPDTERGGERPSRRVLEAHRIVAAAFAEGGSQDQRRQRARVALQELERLAAAAGGETERRDIVRLADPLLRLLSALAPGRDAEVRA